MRNKLKLLRWQVSGGAALILLSLAVTSLLPANTASVHHDPYKQKYDVLLRNGVGTEVVLPGPNATNDQINRAVSAVSAFIHRRSGLEFSPALRNKLATMESRALRDPRRRTPVNQFSEDLADTLIDRIDSLTNVEIQQATDELRGFNAPDLPEAARAARRYVKLRADRAEPLTPESFLAQVRGWRRTHDDDHREDEDGEDGHHRDHHGDSITRRAKDALEAETRSHVRDLARAIPAQWGTTLNCGLSPLQAILIAYSIVSDDPLWFSEVQLTGVLRSIEDSKRRIYGSYPSFNGHFAYGPNGYLFSTPLTIVLDDRTIGRLLHQIDGRRSS